MVNALKLCEGKITRVRNTIERKEESILDFFVVCDQILPLVTKMTIDEKGGLTMTRYKNKVVTSDHKMLKLEIDLIFHMEEKHERADVFNVRNKQCQQVFCEFTSEKNMFTKCFQSQDEDVTVQFSRWKRLLNKAIHTCFRKIRVTQNVERKQSKIDELMNAKKLITRKRKLEQEDEENIDEIEKEITKEIADREYEKLENVMGNLDLDTNTNIWKEMHKAYPSKSNPLPTGVKNAQGKLITNPKEKRKVTLEHFQNRMRKRDIKDDTKEVDDLNTKLFNKRLYLAKLNKSPPFEIKELEKVLKSLKPGKSKDPDDYICELFKDGVIGIDLKISILMMMNKIKEDI